MAPPDTDTLAEIDAGEPSGPNLEFDPDFAALERAALGKPEQQVGDTLIPGEDPDWKQVAAQAAALLDRTHDLRVLALFAVARLQLAGIAGYAGVLRTIRSQLEQRWESIHPQLDPEDDMDPTLRANALLRAAEPGRVLRVLRDLPLAASARAGRVAWRDIAVAQGMIEPEPDRPRLTEAAVRAAFSETDAGTLETLRAAVSGAALDAAAIPAAFDARSGYGTGPEMTELQKLLHEIERALDRYSPAAGAEPPAGELADEPTEPVMPGVAAARGGGPVTASSLQAVSSRADAVHLLQLVRDYYQRYEPSSPLPLLIDRACRLADMDFLDILRDLAPDGLSQAQMVAGARE